MQIGVFSNLPELLLEDVFEGCLTRSILEIRQERLGLCLHEWPALAQYLIFSK